MTRDQIRGQLALHNIESYIKPQPQFIGAEAHELYQLEEKRSKAIRDCAQEWARINTVDEKDYWKRSLPQTLFDTLHNYETTAAVLAAEAFLEQLGWNVTRPERRDVT